MNISCSDQDASSPAPHFIVLAFAGMLENDSTALVDNVLRRPILVSIGVPRGVLIVLRDGTGIVEPQFWCKAKRSVQGHLRRFARAPAASTVPLKADVRLHRNV
jgi:hypothetical protein